MNLYSQTASSPTVNIPVTSPNPTPRARKGKKNAKPVVSQRSANLPQGNLLVDEDDVLVNGGSLRSHGFGRCGGRVLTSKLEQTLCDQLSNAGLTHSHQPRHFEVPMSGESVGAYSPPIVLRGRGRGGKTVVIETAEAIDPVLMGKIVAFREKYGSEFYIIFVAPEEIIDLIPLQAYDESSVSTDLGTLINRLSD